MKKLLIPALLSIASMTLLSSCLGSRQLQGTPEAKIESFENDLDKDTNYVLANEWMVETFNDAESVIQFSDKESGTVKGKYLMKAGYVSTSPYVASTEPKYAIITIRVKDNGCRIEIDPPGGQFYSQKSMGAEYGFTTEMFNENASNLIADFKNRMQRGSDGSDW